MLLICAVVGVAIAQRGHYAGNLRPILGSRYQNAETQAVPAQSNNVAPVQTQQAPAQSAPIRQQAAPIQQQAANRFVPEVNSLQYNNDYDGFGGGFDGGFPNAGFHQQGQGFNPVWFYGR